MTAVDIDPFLLPEIAGLPRISATTPMHRAAGQLQRALPPGWRVQVVEGPREAGRSGQPVLRLVVSDM
ncbi:hypothetical protein [Nocardia inohanensis]|uniref:hypothetical protein n=1 Tax=Nocardia inohanensis TaxID=209246 RepID=UPI00082B8C4D|nr:hypothetical protein [Nocardia inohanensis]